MVDNLGSSSNDSDFYKDNDLSIGAVLNVYGRPFILTTCDEFTKQYYKDRYQVGQFNHINTYIINCVNCSVVQINHELLVTYLEDFTPLQLNEALEREIPAPKPPPYLGWGQEDDLGMWKSLEMKAHVKDYRKQAEFEK